MEGGSRTSGLGSGKERSKVRWGGYRRQAGKALRCGGGNLGFFSFSSEEEFQGEKTHTLDSEK